MITASNFLTQGRLGNILFRYAALIGLAKRYKQELKLPLWKYSKYFKGIYPEGEIQSDKIIQIKEPTFHYTSNLGINNHEHTDLLGYFQSEKYFSNVKEELKEQLGFTTEFKKQVWHNFFQRNDIRGKKTLAISIRRGDYVHNENYFQLPINYYLGAMMERFPDWRERAIIIFSDDTSWARVHFGTLSNVWFSENNDEIEDLCLLSQMDAFIISNSTFSWFGAFIRELQGPVKVIRPNHHFAGRLLRDNNEQDVYPTRWEVYDNLDEWTHRKKLDLHDLSFHIPVFFDSIDREENLNIVLRALADNINCEIIVMEQGGSKFEYLQNDARIRYEKFEGENFHRTRMLNKMSQITKKPFIANWDADVLVAPLQIYEMLQKLRAGADLVYPYSGAFARIPRQPWIDKLQWADIGVVGTTKFSGMDKGDAISLGGCLAWNRKRFFELGGEPEAMIAYAPEDVERYERAVKLGAKIERIDGPMYHINHTITSTSNMSNPHYPAARKELERIRALSADELKEEVKTWPRGL